MGLLIVALFMLFYYRLFGLVANFALALNVVFIVAIMSLLGATLTLPGIAAIVLTVGLAVDANVLIYERIREELRNGMSSQASIFAGYERAFITIVDANVTTLIVAVILFALGTGDVQGFAVTLIIGILTSMVTAIFFTRAIINLIYGSRRRVEKLSIGIKV
jgi:preprotein translocase subunit SecD